MKHVRIVIAGSRDFTDYEGMCAKLDNLFRNLNKKDIQIIAGGAAGADRLAEQYGKERNLPVEIMPANWDRHGKSAGFKRNYRMACNATHCVCFWDGKSKGTSHMMQIAKEKNLQVRTYITEFGSVQA